MVISASAPQRTEPASYWTVGRIIKYAVSGIVVLLVLGAVLGSFYTVDPTERAGVRRFGNVTTATPIGPGLHFKVPFIDTVDRLQVSQTTLALEPFKVKTVDNQTVTLTMDIQMVTPDDAVFHLLYGVGRTGDGDIRSSIAAIVQDRVSRVFSSKNTNSISLDREKIQEETTTVVSETIRNNFKVHVASLQIAKIEYSPAFEESNNNAVLAKNMAIQEENKLKVQQYMSQQKVIAAQGERDQQIAAAEGRNKSSILNAEAEAKATELQAQANANAKLVQVGADSKALLTQASADKQAAELRGIGDASAVKAMVDALGGADKYIAIQQTKVQARWAGGVPQIVLSDKAQPMVMMPGTPALLPTK